MKRLLLTLCIGALLAGCATTTSPTGRRQYVGAVSQAQLDQLGAQAFTEAKQKEKVSSNGKQTTYVQCVVNALVAQLPDQYHGVRWETALFEDNEPNAFALPGGKVGVNTGIFTVAKNQDQLAAVIGHEIGHVIARHHEERITRQMGAQTGLSVLGAIAGAAYGGNASNMVSQLGGAGAQTLFLLPNTREQEAEADEVGQKLMAESGFDPAQAVGLWQNMMALGGQRTAEVLSTHPDPANRVRRLQADLPRVEPLFKQAQASGRRPRCS